MAIFRLLTTSLRGVSLVQISVFYAEPTLSRCRIYFSLVILLGRSGMCSVPNLPYMALFMLRRAFSLKDGKLGTVRMIL
ncbi:hypothetical protein LINPERHAP1_LOCUS24061 [Linum perenne]